MQFLQVGLSTSSLEHGESAGPQDIHLDRDLGAMQIKLLCPRDSATSIAALLRALADLVARA